MGFLFPLVLLVGWASRAALQQRAARPLLALAHLQRRSGGHLEYFPHAVLGLGGALQVAEGADPAGHVAAFLALNGFLRGVKSQVVSRDIVCALIGHNCLLTLSSPFLFLDS